MGLCRGRVFQTSLLALVTTASTIHAAPPPRPTGGHVVTRVEATELPAGTAVRLEGETAKTAFERLTPITGFVQRDPHEGADPSCPTEVRVAYDKTFLYVEVKAFDADPSKIVGLRTRRDSPSPSDWIRVMIDSYHDRRTAYEFAVNPAGVKQDQYWFSDANNDTSWDAVWDVQVAKDAKGWTALFRIPFSQLRFETGKGDAFGFAVIRQVGRLNESSSWPLIAKSKSGFVSQFGELGGLKLGSASKKLELTPYGVGQVGTKPVAAGDPFQNSPALSGLAGADLKYSVTPGLTMTSTINPDFGQVEADPAVVNLTAFETFYQERRPFFVEGSGNFKFDLDCNDGQCTGLFYSRRIGRQPHGSPAAPSGGFLDMPGTTTILGAAKLTGRAGPFSIGALDAVTLPEEATLALGSQTWTQTVEPLTNYLAAQAKREWSNQSSVGFMLTSTNRKLTSDVSFLPSNAVTGGVNWDWRLKDPRYSLAGYWAGSSVTGSTEAIGELQQSAVHNYQRPDATHVEYDPARTSLTGMAGSLGAQKIGGERVRFSFNGSFKTPGFDVNDLGYERSADDISQSAWTQFRWETPTRVYRSFRFNLNQWADWNFDGDARVKGGNVNAHIVLNSNWAAGAGFNVQTAGIDDRTTRGGPSYRTKSGHSLWYYVQTDSRKAVNGIWQSFTFRDEKGATDWGADPEVTFRPTTFLSISAGVHFEVMDEDTQWVDNVASAAGTRYVFGRIHQETLGLTARINYTITPNLTVQIYAQPFVSAGFYGDYKDLVSPRATPFDAQFQSSTYPGNPDFNYKSFRTTNVLRWEYRPGSAVYVVWQQGREGVSDVGSFRYRHDLVEMFGIPASNVFLVKFSYWLNL